MTRGWGWSPCSCQQETGSSQLPHKNKWILTSNLVESGSNILPCNRQHRFCTWKWSCWNNDLKMWAWLWMAVSGRQRNSEECERKSQCPVSRNLSIEDAVDEAQKEVRIKLLETRGSKIPVTWFQGFAEIISCSRLRSNRTCKPWTRLYS